MNKDSSIKANDASNLRDQTKFRLNEIYEMKDYFNLETRERKAMTKNLRKYITAFDYIDKTLIVLFATCEEVSIISFACVIGAPAGIASASFTLVFSLTTEIETKLLQITRNKKKKHDKTVILAKSKLKQYLNYNISALIDVEISNEEFRRIINEEEQQEK